MVWKILRSSLHKISRFSIIEDKVLLPNQKEILFSYIDFSKGVCILAINENKEVLCLRQYRHALKSWEWELPAGAIDPEDKSPLETAKRELQEETGYIADTWTPLGSFFPSPGSTSEEIYLFLATDLVKSVQSLEESEQIEVYPLKLEELKSLVSFGKFQHGGGLAALLRYLVLDEKSS
ncbi:NUDIX hydrolase [Robertmurraya sp. Marseille-Q9965]